MLPYTYLILSRISNAFKPISIRSLKKFKYNYQESIQDITKSKFSFTKTQKLYSTIIDATSLKSTSQEAKNIRRILGIWLAGCSGMVFLTITLGGITRLSESGLSMVTWHLFKETPPRTEEQWQIEFEKYKEYPEFKLKNADLTLDQFKRIWYMEWIHRMSGRTIGAFFALPACYFAYKGWLVGRAIKIRLVAYTLLLGFQGLLGWYMVKSGLDDSLLKDDIPRVSQYRLAAHLGTALVLYSLMLWATMGFLLPKPQVDAKTMPLRSLRRLAHGTKSLVFLTAISGAFVAGLDAGLVYNSFPKMADRWVPDDLWALSPSWKNFFENATTVQFDHRILGTLTLTAVAATWIISRRIPHHLKPRRLKIAADCMMGMAVIQVTLGIATLVTYVPTYLASLHQSGSLVLLSMAVWLTHELRRIPKF